MSVPLYVPPATPLRTKRNFKGLQVDAPSIPGLSLPAPPPNATTTKDPIPTRPAPKKRPPHWYPTFVPPDDLAETPISARRSAITASLTTTLAKLDMNAPRIKALAELGQGNGGSVVKVLHVPSGITMAKKIVLIDAKSSIRKQILRELQIMHDCNSEHIISSYGSYLAEPNICICMEFMDKGSFDSIYKSTGPIPIEVVAKVAWSVLEGLMYLYDVHRIIHRGKIKLCDFGVSGELINSIANTFVGTSVYMSPERIQGAEYSVKSDVWSLGITLIELAAGRFPFSDWTDDDDRSDLEDNSLPDSGEQPFSGIAMEAKIKRESKRESGMSMSKRKSKGVSLHGGSMTMSIIELMHQIVREPAPRLPDGFGVPAEEFVDRCLMKDPEVRGTPGVLLWMKYARSSTFDLKAWTGTF
ncbi:kinase-like domain-containing protein [Cyathus striatus]|nr:kinase-like domain-containing protein [Cyathus striatus]